MEIYMSQFTRYLIFTDDGATSASQLVDFCFLAGRFLVNFQQQSLSGNGQHDCTFLLPGVGKLVISTAQVITGDVIHVNLNM